MIDQARALLAKLATDPTGPSSGHGWKALHTMLKKAPYDQMRLARYIAERNVEEMRKVLDVVAAAPPPAPRQPAYAPTADGSPPPMRQQATPPPLIQVRAEKPTPQQLKTALAAFKKRLKLTKLDQESRIGRSPMTGGIKSNIVAILPPNLYPKIYWEELEKQGQIRNTGGGFYELIDKAKPLRGAAAAAVAKAEANPDAEEAATDEVAEIEASDSEAVDASSEETSPSA